MVNKKVLILNTIAAEGSIDANAIFGYQLRYKGLFIKPIRVSPESGMFSLIYKLEKDVRFLALYILANGYVSFIRSAGVMLKKIKKVF